MTIVELTAKVQVAKDKIIKIEATIEKQKKQREKKVVALNKIFEENNCNITYEDIRDKKNWLYIYENQAFYHDLYWTYCDIIHTEEAITNNLNKLKDARVTLKNWEEKLRLEQVKLQYIQDSIPDIIKQFLNEWKTNVIKYYVTKAEQYPEALIQYRAEKHRLYFDLLVKFVNNLLEENNTELLFKYCRNNDYLYDKLLDAINNKYNPNEEYTNLIYFGYRDQNNPKFSNDYIRLEEQWKFKFGDGFFCTWKDHNFDSDWLNKEIEEEKNNKLIDLMTRVSKITGEIIDATNLYIADDGNLNGFIIGKDGKATVETITAGGYNEHIILDSGRHGQCAHFRVLVHKIKE